MGSVGSVRFMESMGSMGSIESMGSGGSIHLALPFVRYNVNFIIIFESCSMKV